jgi:uncharacterized protein (TIGR03118 family)
LPNKRSEDVLRQSLPTGGFGLLLRLKFTLGEMNMSFRRTAVPVCSGLALLIVSAVAHAQYQLTNLVSNQFDEHAVSTDPLLVNAWGLARSASSPWWVSDNLSGWSTLYNAAGTPSALRVLIPTAGGGPVEPTGNNGIGTPTGIVANGSKTDFQISGKSTSFIFATLDGTISAWPGVTVSASGSVTANKNLATIVVDNSANKASYTGLAITSNASGNFLYAADNTNNKIDMYDGNFNLAMSFGDPSIPSAFSVFGVQDINAMLYVTYAATDGGAGGYVDEFKEDGTFVKTLIKGAVLNQPWGVALAPSNFGPLSNTLLISNNSNNGDINGFDPASGGFVATIRDVWGRKITLVNLWGVAFGGGTTNNGPSNTLFVTAGPGKGTQAQLAGTFASITYVPPPSE